MDEFGAQHTFKTCVFLVVVSEMRNYTHFTYFSIHILFFDIVTSQFKDLATTLLSSCVSMSSTPKNFRDLSISLRNILYHRRVQHTVRDPIPYQFCSFFIGPESDYCQGCIFRLTCSHHELTKDHVFTSACVNFLESSREMP